MIFARDPRGYDPKNAGMPVARANDDRGVRLRDQIVGQPARPLQRKSASQPPAVRGSVRRARLRVPLPHLHLRSGVNVVPSRRCADGRPHLIVDQDGSRYPPAEIGGRTAATSINLRNPGRVERASCNAPRCTNIRFSRCNGTMSATVPSATRSRYCFKSKSGSGRVLSNAWHNLKTMPTLHKILACRILADLWIHDCDAIGKSRFRFVMIEDQNVDAALAQIGDFGDGQMFRNQRRSAVVVDECSQQRLDAFTAQPVSFLHPQRQK